MPTKDIPQMRIPQKGESLVHAFSQDVQYHLNNNNNRIDAGIGRVIKGNAAVGGIVLARPIAEFLTVIGAAEVLSQVTNGSLSQSTIPIENHTIHQEIAKDNTNLIENEAEGSGGDFNIDDNSNRIMVKRKGKMMGC